jgi:ubiquinone/menaquinone biosynthesis C-methylase UbiE
MKKFSKLINDQFWNITFKTGIYDFVVMSSYDHSLQSITDVANIDSKNNVIDVGCGSGRQLHYIGNKLKQTGSIWTGLELTPGGINACKKRITDMGLEKNASVKQADMTKPLPVDENSVDIAIAHFSFYVLPQRENRVTAFKNIAKTLKNDGKMYIAIPGKNYNAKDQVISSLSLNKQNKDISFFRKQWNRIMFPTIGFMSEKAVTKRIKEGVWHSFTKEEIETEAGEAGFKLEWIKDVYGETSFMAAFSK